MVQVVCQSLPQTAKTGERQRFVNDGSLAYDSLEPLQQFVKLMAYNNCEKVRVRDLENIGCLWSTNLESPASPPEHTALSELRTELH